jgi:hypothetical protein
MKDNAAGGLVARFYRPTFVIISREFIVQNSERQEQKSLSWPCGGRHVVDVIISLRASFAVLSGISSRSGSIDVLQNRALSYDAAVILEMKDVMYTPRQTRVICGWNTNAEGARSCWSWTPCTPRGKLELSVAEIRTRRVLEVVGRELSHSSIEHWYQVREYRC